MTLLRISVLLVFGPLAFAGSKLAKDLPPGNSNVLVDVIVQFKTPPAKDELKPLGPSECPLSPAEPLRTGRHPSRCTGVSARKRIVTARGRQRWRVIWRKCLEREESPSRRSIFRVVRLAWSPR